MADPTLRAAAALTLLTALTLTGCTSTASPPAVSAPVAGAALEHVHGVDYDPATGATYAAAHGGVFLVSTEKLPDSYGTGPASISAGGNGPIAGRAQDTMGFTIADTGTLFASGHPDPNDPAAVQSPNLGLIRSSDGAQTWEPVSLAGETDFHDIATTVLPSGATRIYGYDAARRVLRISDDDGSTWRDGAALGTRDIAVDAGNPDRVFATTEDGLAVSVDAGSTFAPVDGAPALFVLDAIPVTAGGGLVGVDVESRVWTSTTDGQWEARGSVAGTVQAFSYVEGENPWILAFDDNGLRASGDYGDTWTVLPTS